MNENILSAGSLDEPVTFSSIEPLHYTLLLHSPSPSYFGWHNGEDSVACPFVNARVTRRSLSRTRNAASHQSARRPCAVAARIHAKTGLCFPDTKTSNAVGLPCTYRRLPPAHRAPFMAGNQPG